MLFEDLNLSNHNVYIGYVGFGVTIMGVYSQIKFLNSTPVWFFRQGLSKAPILLVLYGNSKGLQTT